MADPDSKTCLVCKQTLPIESFHRDKNRKDGRYPYCKPCHTVEASARCADPKRKAHKREYDRQRVARLRDKLSEQGRARYQRKRADIMAYVAQWQKDNPERVRATKQSYKHRRRAVERVGMTGTALAAWKRVQLKVCHWCGVKCANGYVVDHIQPLSKGGQHEAHNLAISCRSCNASKSARDPIEFAQSIGNLL